MSETQSDNQWQRVREVIEEIRALNNVTELDEMLYRAGVRGSVYCGCCSPLSRYVYLRTGIPWVTVGEEQTWWWSGVGRDRKLHSMDMMPFSLAVEELLVGLQQGMYPWLDERYTVERGTSTPYGAIR